MSKSTSKFSRSVSTRHYRRVYYIFSEGSETEPLYCEGLRSISSKINLKVKAHKTQSAPLLVKKRVQKFLKKKKAELREGDAIWVLVDVDNWERGHLEELRNWCERTENCFLGISNPKFEYFLLLHFEPARGVKTVKDCERRLEKHMRCYDKNKLDMKALMQPMAIENAIRHGKRRLSECENPYEDYHTTVHKMLIEIKKA